MNTQTFGNWTLIGGRPKTVKEKVLCRCQCGTERMICYQALRDGKTKSCGCMRSHYVSQSKIKHGKYGTPVYKRWADMLDRCSRKSHVSYPLYGGRGIKVCKRWHQFKNFYKDMGDVPEGKTLDRIDSDGDYKPSNCRWATMVEQQNNKRSNRVVEFEGKAQTVAEWSREKGVNATTIFARLRRGETDESLFRKYDPHHWIEHNGEVKTLTAWSRVTGVNVETLRLRLEKGIPLETALTKESIARYRTITHDGQTRTIREWSEITGLGVKLINWRHRQGWEPARILTAPTHGAK
jgi:hypothetical protein